MHNRCSATVAFCKTEVKALLGLALSDRERELIRYSVFKASGISSTAARKSLGFEHMNQRAERVEMALQEARCISETVEDIARTQDKALLQSMGFVDAFTDTESDSESDCTKEDPTCPPEEHLAIPALPIGSADSALGLTCIPDDLPFHSIGMQSRWNFFDIVSEVEMKVGSFQMSSTHGDR